MPYLWTCEFFTSVRCLPDKIRHGITCRIIRSRCTDRMHHPRRGLWVQVSLSWLCVPRVRNIWYLSRLINNNHRAARIAATMRPKTKKNSIPENAAGRRTKLIFHQQLNVIFWVRKLTEEEEEMFFFESVSQVKDQRSFLTIEFISAIVSGGQFISPFLFLP